MSSGPNWIASVTSRSTGAEHSNSKQTASLPAKNELDFSADTERGFAAHPLLFSSHLGALRIST
jgi:hypothetical protein